MRVGGLEPEAHDGPRAGMGPIGVLYGNWATDRAVVQACCGKDVCVTLYASTHQGCLIPILEYVLPLFVKNKIGGAEVQRAMDAMRALVKPEQMSNYERGEAEMLKRAFAQMEEPKS